MDASFFKWPQMGSTNDNMNAGAEFVKSNSVVGKIAFLLLVVLVFVIVLRFGTMMLAWAVTPSGKVVLIDGLVPAKDLIHIHQNPNVKGSKPINRSVDEDKGVEFTWSVWVFVDGDDEDRSRAHHIFHKGNAGLDGTTGYNKPNNAPGMYLKYATSTKDNVSTNDRIDLDIRMNTFANQNESIVIQYIPVRKWVSIIFTCDGNFVNVYINGTLARRHELSGVPRQNYGDVYACMGGGFAGQISDLRYYDHEMSNFMINYTYMLGPNRKVVGKMLGDTSTSYLSSRWFFAGNEDAYNPE